MKGRTALVSLLAIGLFAWFLNNSNPAEVWRHVTAARPEYLLLALVFVIMPYWLRTVRWQCLLAPLGPTRFRVVMRAMIVGFAALALLPGRVGDVLRPYLVSRQEGLSLPATFATVVMERVLDLVAVLTMLSVFVWTVDTVAVPPAVMRPITVSALIAAAAAVALVIIMWVLATHPERVGGLVRTADRILPHALAHRLAVWVSTFSTGFAAARRPREFALAVAWSFPVWLAFSAETWAVSKAFGIEMPLPGAFLLQAMLVLGVAVPTPGGVGSFHAFYKFGVTTFFGASDEAAVAAAIVLHAISFVPISLAGLVVMAQDGLTFGRMREIAGAAREGEA
jgi:uncharacterized protein (TIRG00374 family)